MPQGSVWRSHPSPFLPPERLSVKLRLSAENLVVRRGTRRIIDGLSFAAPAGRAVLLTGPNGAGKTTLIRAIAGFLAIEAGVLSLEGGDSERDIGEQAHYVGHANGIKSTLTVAENLRFWAEYLDQPASRQRASHEETADRVDHALERLKLIELEDIPAAYLSAGQKRRLGLGRLMVAERPLWLLDEPTVSLDTASVAILAGIIEDHLAAGGLAIAATHIPLGLTNVDELRLAAAAAVHLAEDA